jgi:creatinine amidohydrolase
MSEPPRYALAELTTDRFAALLAGDRPVVVLVPVGSVEPHGPHLTLPTDTAISEAAAMRALHELKERVTPLIAPSVPYGVTECARQFPGAVSVPAAALTAFLRGIVESLLGQGVAHVCLVNNHLEPAHDAAVRAAVDGLPGRASVASPLTKRWARTLSDEFKTGACHAGRYETSIVLAHEPWMVDEEVQRSLPDVPISLATKLREGVTDFVDMGLSRAYAGSPREASAEEGEELIDRLGTMVATEVLEALGLAVSS